MQENESATRCIGCCNPNWEVTASTLEPSYDSLWDRGKIRIKLRTKHSQGR